jgi:hypothetical protein
MTRRSGHCSLSDALKAASHMVNIYNDSPLEEDQGMEMLVMLHDAVERIQAIPPMLFTVDEVDWVNTLADQLIEIESCMDEDDDINNWKIEDNFSPDSRNEDDYDKENNS